MPSITDLNINFIESTGIPKGYKSELVEYRVHKISVTDCILSEVMVTLLHFISLYLKWKIIQAFLLDILKRVKNTTTGKTKA